VQGALRVLVFTERAEKRLCYSAAAIIFASRIRPAVEWCTNLLRSKVDPMKDLAIMIRAHFDGITAPTRISLTGLGPSA
jgi:hypothetical protein